MRRPFAVTLAAALVVSGSYAQAGQDAGPKMDLVAGTGQFQPQTLDLEIHVNAKSGPLGEDPKGTFFVRRNSTPLLNLDFRGRVTCLNVVGNRAVVGGEITESKLTDALPGQGVLMQFNDNGEGNDDPPDQFNGFFTATPPQVCPPPPVVGTVPIDQGNFIVRDAVQ